MTATYANQEMLEMVDAENGVVDRRIFSEHDIYELELERIFARAWNFMCHDSQIPDPGDFFMTFIGEDRVICIRDNDGNPQVLVNSCRHRGNAICRAEEGHATSFMCTYHGWTYDLKGDLVGVPGFKEVYHEELDRENWGLIKAAQVDKYKGFIFANMDPKAPGLEEYLGETGSIGLSLMAERGNLKVIPGVQKFTIPCNWKIATDNIYDWYHAPLTHASAFTSGFAQRRAGDAPAPRLTLNASFGRPQVVVLGEYGHAISGPAVGPETAPQFEAGFKPDWRERPEAQKGLGQVGLRSAGHPMIFPNLWIVTTSGQFAVRMPKGPSSTEIWFFTFVDADSPQQMQDLQRFRAGHTFGPAGFLEQDDGENWAQSTISMKGSVTRRYPVNFKAGLGRGEIEDDEQGPPRIDTLVNEHAQVWLYQAWADWMAAPDWSDLKANHSRIGDRI